MLKVVVILLFCVVQTLFAAPSPKGSWESSLNNTFLQLIIDKATNAAYLMTWPESSRKPTLVKKYQIGMGKIKGDKQYEGDLKTPEGIYFTSTAFSKPGQYEKFGPLAIPLSYPNAIDLSDKKTGSGIWLHGVGLDRSLKDKYITEGCVAFSNSQIEDLKSALLPFQSVVVITDGLSGVSSTKSLKAIEQKTLEWAKAWASRDIDQYRSFYAEGFADPYRGNYKQYFRYKQAVFNRYKEMIVKMNNVRVVIHPKYAVSIMSQYFKGDTYLEGRGTKILYWKKNPKNHWQIFREEYNEAYFHPQKMVKFQYKTLDATSL